MKNNKKENKACFILHTITSLLFATSGIIMLVTKKSFYWPAVTNIALSVTFGSLAVIYFKKTKEEK